MRKLLNPMDFPHTLSWRKPDKTFSSIHRANYLETRTLCGTDIPEDARTASASRKMHLKKCGNCERLAIQYEGDLSQQTAKPRRYG